MIRQPSKVKYKGTLCVFVCGYDGQAVRAATSPRPPVTTALAPPPSS